MILHKMLCVDFFLVLHISVSYGSKISICDMRFQPLCPHTHIHKPQNNKGGGRGPSPSPDLWNWVSNGTVGYEMSTVY